MGEIKNEKIVPEWQPIENNKHEIKIEPINKTSIHRADDIFNRMFDDNLDVDRKPKINNVDLKEHDSPQKIKKMSLKDADKVYESVLNTDKESSDNKEVEDEKQSDVEVKSETETKADSDEKETRELTEDEKQYLKEKLGWSDDKIKKCTIDKNGVYHYKTDRCDLEGKTSENGIPYERRTVEINGIKIEGVFPKFESIFDTQLNPDKLKTKVYAKECNAKLKEAIEKNPELKKKFTEEQLKDIAEGRTPTGYVWHHNEEPGKMQLVKREDHDRVIGGAAHTGGNSLWGADSVDNSKKGESF